jgi:hypothetical protein
MGVERGKVQKGAAPGRGPAPPRKIVVARARLLDKLGQKIDSNALDERPSDAVRLQAIARL